MDKQETILFAPLNWGLGHATRMVPLIEKALADGNNVILAGSGSVLNFLKIEFPNTETVLLKGYRVRYAPKPFFLIYLLVQMPFFYASIWLEHFRLKQLIKAHTISRVVSDNRYGLWNKNVKSIILTHQLFIQLPKGIRILEPLLHRFTHILLSPFSECWIPDYEDYGKSLSGNLSHGKILPKNIKYIGPLSRFSKYIGLKHFKAEDSYDVLVLISGPEPQRSQFEQEMQQRFINNKQHVLMVCGRPQTDLSERLVINNIVKVAHVSTAKLHFHLLHSKHIIARAGYSTLMDLHVLGLQAELIPTPGQTEQEYLALWGERTKTA